MQKIKVDLNNPGFQKDFFSLEKIELAALMNTLKKISQLSWSELYRDKGLKWEAVASKKTSERHQIYSFRFSKKYRALALRQGEFLRVLSLHLDHDSAYH
jgi:hypothetical protein